MSEKESFFKIFFRKKIKESFLKIFFRSIEKDSFFGNLFSKTEKRFFFQKSVFVKRKELQENLFSDSKFFHHIKIKKIMPYEDQIESNATKKPLIIKLMVNNIS